MRGGPSSSGAAPTGSRPPATRASCAPRKSIGGLCRHENGPPATPRGGPQSRRAPTPTGRRHARPRGHGRTRRASAGAGTGGRAGLRAPPPHEDTACGGGGGGAARGHLELIPHGYTALSGDCLESCKRKDRATAVIEAATPSKPGADTSYRLTPRPTPRRHSRRTPRPRAIAGPRISWRKAGCLPRRV